MSYFPESNNHDKSKTKVELDLPNYAAKSDLKGATIINISKVPDWPNLKSDVDNLDIGKLETVPVDLNKLRNVVKDEVVKNAV